MDGCEVERLFVVRPDLVSSSQFEGSFFNSSTYGSIDTLHNAILIDSGITMESVVYSERDQTS